MLPYHFFLFEVFRLEHWDITTILGLFFLSFARSPGQPQVLVDQEWRSNKSCLGTSPKHQFDLHKRPTAQALLLAHASPEVLPSAQCPRSPQLAYVCLKYGRTCIDHCHGALDCNDFHLQQFSRFPSLLDLALIFLPVKHIFPVVVDHSGLEQSSIIHVFFTPQTWPTLRKKTQFREPMCQNLGSKPGYGRSPRDQSYRGHPACQISFFSGKKLSSCLLLTHL